MVLILTQSAWDATASGTLTTGINKPHTQRTQLLKKGKLLTRKTKRHLIFLAEPCGACDVYR